MCKYTFRTEIIEFSSVLLWHWKLYIQLVRTLLVWIKVYFCNVYLYEIDVCEILINFKTTKST